MLYASFADHVGGAWLCSLTVEMIAAVALEANRCAVSSDRDGDWRWCPFWAVEVSVVNLCGIDAGLLRRGGSLWAVSPGRAWFCVRELCRAALGNVLSCGR